MRLPRSHLHVKILGVAPVKSKMKVNLILKNIKFEHILPIIWYSVVVVFSVIPGGVKLIPGVDLSDKAQHFLSYGSNYFRP